MSIYKDIKATDERSQTRSILYEATCSVCGKKVSGRKGDLLKTSLCRHATPDSPSIQYGLITDIRLRYIFQGMVHRCYHSYDKSFRWYGGKGITICQEWLRHPWTFQAWIESELIRITGDKEWVKGLSIDRIDSNKNYEPSNCRVIPFKENCVNNTSPITVQYRGENITLNGNDWSKKLGLPKGRINTIRWKYGKDVAVSFIVGSLDGKPPTLPDNRVNCGKAPRHAHIITIGSTSNTAAEWERVYGLKRGRIASIKFRYGNEEVGRYLWSLSKGEAPVLPDNRKFNGREVSKPNKKTA